MIGNPAMTAIVIAVLVALAFSGGFALSDWRMASRLQQLNSNNAVLSAANDKCATDIHATHEAMERIATLATKEESRNSSEDLTKSGYGVVGPNGYVSSFGNLPEEVSKEISRKMSCQLNQEFKSVEIFYR